MIKNYHENVGPLLMEGIREPGFLDHLETDIKPKLEGEDIYYIVSRIFLELTEKHVFWDGNKRTAFATATTILALGNRTITADDETIEKYCLDTSEKFELYEKGLIGEDELPTPEEVSKWFEAHSRPAPIRYFTGMFLGIILALVMLVLVIPVMIFAEGVEGLLNRLRGA